MSTIIPSLRSLLDPVAKQLVFVSDGPNGFNANTTKPDANGKPEFFAAAQVKKNYVAFYFMPVYCYPELLKGMSPELKKRMQGKSCFNFKDADPTLMKELGALVKAGMAKYKAKGKA